MHSFTRFALAGMGLALAAPIAAQTAAPTDAQQRYTAALSAYSEKDFATATPLLIGLCEEGYAQTCAAAGMLIANGQGVKQDVPKALALFKRGCAGKRAESCRSAADIYEQAAAPIRDASQAARYELKACDLQDFASCAKLADRYATGIGVEKSRASAFYLASKGCEGGDGAACTSLGRLYVPYPKTQKEGPKYNLAKAIEYYRIGCERKDGRGCALLADKYDFGSGVERDIDKALELYRRALSYEPAPYVQNSAKGRIRELSEEQAGTAPAQ